MQIINHQQYAKHRNRQLRETQENLRRKRREEFEVARKRRRSINDVAVPAKLDSDKPKQRDASLQARRSYVVLGEKQRNVPKPAPEAASKFKEAKLVPKYKSVTAAPVPVKPGHEKQEFNPRPTMPEASHKRPTVKPIPKAIQTKPVVEQEEARKDDFDDQVLSNLDLGDDVAQKPIIQEKPKKKKRTAKELLLLPPHGLLRMVKKPFIKLSRTKQFRHVQKQVQPILDKLFPTNQKLALSLSALGILVFASGMFVSIRSLQFNQNAINEVAQVYGATEVSDPSLPPSSAGDPSADVQPDVGAWSVAPEAPRYFSIPKFGVKARVLAVGTTPEGAMDTPQTVHDVGWYNRSALPGSGEGAVVVDGHVSGYTTTGVFYRIKDLVAGDQVTVERGDGEVFTYEVVEVRQVDADNVDMEEFMKPVDWQTEGLNMITCGGSFDAASRSYNDRILVFTKRI